MASDKSYLSTKYKMGMEEFIQLLNNYYEMIDQCWIAGDKDLNDLEFHTWLSPSIFYMGTERSLNNNTFTLIKIKI